MPVLFFGSAILSTWLSSFRYLREMTKESCLKFWPLCFWRWSYFYHSCSMMYFKHVCGCSFILYSIKSGSGFNVIPWVLLHIVMAFVSVFHYYYLCYFLSCIYAAELKSQFLSSLSLSRFISHTHMDLDVADIQFFEAHNLFQASFLHWRMTYFSLYIFLQFPVLISNVRQLEIIYG